jgi:hypothetical protein
MTKRVNTTFTDKQAREINKRVGLLGNSEADVVNTIVAMWLYNEKRK